PRALRGTAAHALAAGHQAMSHNERKSIMRNLHQLSAASIAVAIVVASGVRALAGDAAQGEHVFAVCAPCHARDTTSRLGPGLLGIVGRRAGAVPGFRYSRVMKTANIVWDDKSLDAFITAPQRSMPGTTMPFSGLPDQQKRTDLIAYLE